MNTSQLEENQHNIFIGYILALRLTGLISQKEIRGLIELMDKIMSRLAIKNSN